MSRLKYIAAAVGGLLLLTLSIGCFETTYSLGTVGDAKVNHAFIGDFSDHGKDGASTLAIRNIDDKQYYVEMQTPTDKTPARMVGYTADVNGVTFAHLRVMEDDGDISPKHFIERIAISDDGSKLTLRDLNDKFFADKNIDSDDSLKTVIAANLDNPDMYDGDAKTLTRVAPEKNQ
jgi:hypothetical protein